MKHDKQRRTAMVLGLAALAIMVTATHAHATPIRFDNPVGGGHFNWQGEWLDLTLPAASQPGVQGDLDALLQSAAGDPDPEVWGDPATTSVKVQAGGSGDFFLVGVDEGVMIPSGAAWKNLAYMFYPGYGTQLPIDEPTYLGVQFDLGSGLQYGWIGVEMDDQYALDPFAWGYETEVGVPIPAGIPEPGSLAALAVGVAALASRRRRRSAE